MKPLLTFTSLFIFFLAGAQVTTEQVRPVDSLLVHTYLESPTFHTMSVLSPGLYIWTAGSGLYDGNFINWTHEGKVHPDTIAIANSLPNQYLGSFDLDAYDHVTHYQQAVENWLSGIDLPVGVMEADYDVYSVYPNPTSGNALLEVKINEGEEYSVKVFDPWGRKVIRYQGISYENTIRIELQLAEFADGLSVIDFRSKSIRFRSKVLKK